MPGHLGSRISTCKQFDGQPPAPSLKHLHRLRLPHRHRPPDVRLEHPTRQPSARSRRHYSRALGGRARRAQVAIHAGGHPRWQLEANIPEHTGWSTCAHRLAHQRTPSCLPAHSRKSSSLPAHSRKHISAGRQLSQRPQVYQRTAARLPIHTGQSTGTQRASKTADALRCASPHRPVYRSRGRSPAHSREHTSTQPAVYRYKPTSAPSGPPARTGQSASARPQVCQRTPARVPAHTARTLQATSVPQVYQHNASNLRAHSCKPASTQPSQPPRAGNVANARCASTLAQACHHRHTRALARSAQALMPQAASAQPPSAGALPHCATEQPPAYQRTASTQPAHERQSTSTYLPVLAHCCRSTSACPLGRQTGQSTSARPPVDKHRAASLLARASQSFGGYAPLCQSPTSLPVHARQSASAKRSPPAHTCQFQGFTAGMPASAAAHARRLARADATGYRRAAATLPVHNLPPVHQHSRQLTRAHGRPPARLPASQPIHSLQCVSTCTPIF